MRDLWRPTKIHMYKSDLVLALKSTAHAVEKCKKILSFCIMILFTNDKKTLPGDSSRDLLIP